MHSYLSNSWIVFVVAFRAHRKKPVLYYFNPGTFGFDSNRGRLFLQGNSSKLIHFTALTITSLSH